MIIWLNGTFGVGKTATARELAARMPNSRLFDAEVVGYLLAHVLPDHEFHDFQDLAPWRTLVPFVTAEIASFTGQHLLATQSVLNAAYWSELRSGFNRHSVDVFHVVLHADSETLTRRIEDDREEPKARHWRLDHIADYLAARQWLESAADLVIDSTKLSVAEVATSVLRAVSPRG